jgi:hypothetical protein
MGATDRKDHPMSQFTEDLSTRLQEKLTQHFARVPGETPISVPTKMIASAVEELLANGRKVPEIPRYDAELAAAQRWSGLTLDPTDVPASIAVDTAHGGIVFTVQLPVEYDEDAPAEPAPPIVLETMPTDARALALHILSVCEEAERADSTPKLHGAAADAELGARGIRVLGS